MNSNNYHFENSDSKDNKWTKNGSAEESRSAPCLSGQGQAGKLTI